jgi:hypothetical protein
MTLKPLNELQSLEIRRHGIYYIYLIDKHKNPCVINRFLKSDKTGLLYIGAAERTTLKYRLNSFLNSMSSGRRQNNHSGGNKIFVNPSLAHHINKHFLFFGFEESENAKELERIKLSEYRYEFGEAPPLNG